MPWRLARSSTKKRVWVGWPPRLTWRASMTLAKPSRAEPDGGLSELRGVQVAAVAGPAGVQELALGRRALAVLDLQVLAEGGRVRNR
jgi:hypothetical protein